MVGNLSDILMSKAERDEMLAHKKELDTELVKEEAKMPANTVIQKKKDKIETLIAMISKSLEKTDEYRDLETINALLKKCVDENNRSFTKSEMQVLNGIYQKYMNPKKEEKSEVFSPFTGKRMTDEELELELVGDHKFAKGHAINYPML